MMIHGIDLTRFVPPTEQKPSDTFRIISVGRAVAKKGYDDLIAALEALPADLNWTFEHIGGGPLLKGFKARTQTGPHAGRITWHGARPQEDVIDLLTRGDLFVLASHNQSDGDRDGIPNVLLEAMAIGLPVAANDAGAISELILDGDTGVLVPAGDVDAFAKAIAALANDPDRRAALATQGQRAVRASFDARRWADELAKHFAAMVPEAAP